MDIIQLPENDFSRQFVVSSGEAEFAGKFLNAVVSGAILRLTELGRPPVDINPNAVRVEVGSDLSSPRKEDTRRQFLEAAETIIERATQDDIGETFENALDFEVRLRFHNADADQSRREGRGMCLF